MDDDLLLEYEGSRGHKSPDRERRRRLATSALICGLAFVGFGQLSTGAFFNDSASAGYTYGSGDVEVRVGDTVGANSSAFDLPNFSTRAPGDVSYQPFYVKNTGDLELFYLVKGQTTSTSGSASPLSDVLQYDLYSVASKANCDAAGVIDTSSSQLNAATVILPDGAAPRALSAPTPRRVLTAASGDWLCLRITFDPSADRRYENGLAKVKLIIDAEQNANNP